MNYVKYIILMLSVLLFTQKINAMLILQASKDDRHVIYVPTHHWTNVNTIATRPELAFVLKLRNLVVEMTSYYYKAAEGEAAVPAEEEVYFYTLVRVPDPEGTATFLNAIREGEGEYTCKHLHSKAYLAEKGALLAEGDTRWGIADEDLRNKFAETMAPLDFDFDCTELKKAVAFYMYFNELNRVRSKDGMDEQIEEAFRWLGPPKVTSRGIEMGFVVGLETRKDRLESYHLVDVDRESLSEANFIKAMDKIRYYSHTLEGIVAQWEKGLGGAMTFDAESMRLRHNVWVPRLNALPTDTLVCVGQWHFPGEQGLINRMRALGWMWSKVIVSEEANVVLEPLGAI
jgi:hypothetical protein